jgi:hypothetical protein
MAGMIYDVRTHNKVVEIVFIIHTSGYGFCSSPSHSVPSSLLLGLTMSMKNDWLGTWLLDYD